MATIRYGLMLISLAAKNSAKANGAQDILTAVTAQRRQLTLLTIGNDSPTDAPHVGPAIPLPRSLEAGATGEFP